MALLTPWGCHNRDDVVQHRWDAPGDQIAEGRNGAVQDWESPNLPETVMKTGIQWELQQEADLLGVCRHPNVMQAFALVLEEDVEGPHPQEHGFLVVERLGCSLSSLLYPTLRSALTPNIAFYACCAPQPVLRAPTHRSMASWW